MPQEPAGDVAHPACWAAPDPTVSRAAQPPSAPLQPRPRQVVVYHGAKRGGTTKEMLQSADVVLTTYSTIEADYRRTMMPAKVACT